MECFSPRYKEVYDFVISIAEPKSRQAFIHYYEINPSSLNAAVTLGLSIQEIIDQLNHYNKMKFVTPEVEKHIRFVASSFGKAKLVLKENRYFIESEDKTVIEFYKGMSNLADCWLEETIVKEGYESDDEDTRGNASTFPNTTAQNGSGTAKEPTSLEKLLRIKENEKFIERYEQMIQENEEQDEVVVKKTVYRLEIDPQKIDKVKTERANMSNEEKFKYMLTQEYDYKKETLENPVLEFRLKTSVKIRPYQEKALSRMFVEGRARSGIIVLPCGAGKTLVGIIAMSRVKRRTLVLCINNITVKQWEKQILDFSTLSQSSIFKFISGPFEERVVPDLNQSCVVISTYTMISRTDEGRSAYSKEFITKLGQVEWGLLVLDEVQVAPAEVFKKAFLTKTKSHCKLGLTATLVREDNKIEDLQFYIVASWLLGTQTIRRVLERPYEPRVFG